MEDTKICVQREKVSEIARMKTETSQNVPLGTTDLGFFEVLSHHGDEVEDDESTNETTERGQTFCWKFRTLCNEGHQDEEDPFFDWDGKQEPANGSLGTKRTEV